MRRSTAVCISVAGIIAGSGLFAAGLSQPEQEKAKALVPMQPVSSLVPAKVAFNVTWDMGYINVPVGGVLFLEDTISADRVREGYGYQIKSDTTDGLVLLYCGIRSTAKETETKYMAIVYAAKPGEFKIAEAMVNQKGNELSVGRTRTIKVENP